MCGLTGVLSSTLSALDQDIFNDLMTISCLRGQNGAGITMVPAKEKKGIKVIKTRDSGMEILNHKEFTKYNQTEKSALIGHTRYPTRGGNSINDIHPHEVGPIILNHNGTMDEIDGQEIKKSENDSRILAAKLSTKELYEFLPTSMGPCAMVWVDKKTDTLNFYRNKYRHLFFAYSATGPDTIYWASELGFLYLALRRNTLNVEFKYIALPVDHHWTFPLRPDEYEYIKLSGKETVSCKEPPPPPPPTNGTSGTNGASVIHLPASRLPSSGVPAIQIQTHPEDHTLNTYRTKDGSYIFKTELETVLRDGCYNCRCIGTWSEYGSGTMHWIEEKKFICDQCYKSDLNARGLVEATERGVRVL